MLDLLLTGVSIFLDSQWGLLAFVTVSLIMVLLFSRRKSVFLASLVASVVIAALLQVFLGQSRPCVFLESAILCPSSPGFPSVHATLGMAIALGVLGTRLFWPFLFLGLLSGFSRVWLGVHTVDQVLGGWALAVMVYIAIFQIYERFFAREAFNFDEFMDDNLLNKTVDFE